MSQTTHSLALPLMQASQSKKHITHNAALDRLDAVVQLSVLGIADAPPSDPEPGARYLVGDAPSDAFEGHAGAVARFERGGAWSFHPTGTGWLCWNDATGSLLVRRDGAWGAVTGQAVRGLKVSAPEAGGDSLNVEGESALLSAAPDGSGDMRLKINRSSDSAVASVVFQSAFGGRAEIGLSGGGNALAVRVSEDGQNWTDALTLDPGDGTAGSASIRASVPLLRGEHAVLDAGNTPDTLHYRATIPGGADLDTYIETGYYLQTHSDRAASGQNYPEDHAGLLIVHGVQALAFQTYRIHARAPGGLADAVFTRAVSAGVWTAWKRLGMA